MTHIDGPHTRSSAHSMRRVASSSLIGCVLEWYDFYLYGFVAALVFGPIFFPNASPVLGTLASLGTFAAGFVARPVGAIIFGHFGDRLGRKKMLITTLMIMGTGSFLIGVLPPYSIIGVWAPALLITLRLLQGIGLGGEWGGAVLMVVEHSPHNRRGWWGGVIQLGATLGQAIATGLLFAFSVSLTNEQFLSWGWRIPFIISSLLTIVGLFIRLKVAESPEFDTVKTSSTISRVPFWEALRYHWKAVLTCFLIYVGAITVPFYIQGVYLSSYGVDVLSLNRTSVLLGVAVLHGTAYCAIVLSGGRLTDRIGPRRTILYSLVALLVTPAIGLAIVSTDSIVNLILGILILAAPLWIAWGAVPAYFTSVFPVKLRYTGVSVAGQASTILGGMVPLVLTAVMPLVDGAVWPIGVITIGCAAIALFVMLAITRGARGTESGFESLVGREPTAVPASVVSAEE